LVKIATRPDEIARALGEQGLPRGPPAAEQTVTIHGQLAFHFMTATSAMSLRSAR